jgi:hypothetical protein
MKVATIIALWILASGLSTAESRSQGCPGTAAGASALR